MSTLKKVCNEQLTIHELDNVYFGQDVIKLTKEKAGKDCRRSN